MHTISIAEEIVFSDFSEEQLQQHLILYLSNLKTDGERLDLLDQIGDQLFQIEQELSWKNIILLQLCLDKAKELFCLVGIEDKYQYAQRLFDKGKNRKEIECFLLCMQHVKQINESLNQVNASQEHLRIYKQIDNLIKARLHKFLRDSDQFALWRNHYLLKFQAQKEKELFNIQYTNKQMEGVLLSNFNYDEHRQRIQLIFKITQQNLSLFPLTIDFCEIMMLWQLSLRGDSEQQLVCDIIREIQKLIQMRESLIHRTYFIFMSFLKLDYKGLPKDHFDCRKSLHLFIKSMKVEQLKRQTVLTVQSFLSSHADTWYYSLKNLIMMTTDKLVYMIISIECSFMLAHQLFPPLLKVLDNLIAQLYVFLKFNHCMNGALDILSSFILGTSCSQKVFSKHVLKIQTSLSNISLDSDIRLKLFYLSHCLIHKYKDNSTDTTQFKAYLDNLDIKQEINQDNISIQLKLLDWTNKEYHISIYNKIKSEIVGEGINMNLHQSPSNINSQTTNQIPIKLQSEVIEGLKGLQNLGNSKITL